MPRTPKVMSDSGLLEAALEGLYLQQQRIQSQIAEVKALLGQRRSSDAHAGQANGEAPLASAGKRQLSEAARKRIAAAQKKRWAEYRRSMRAVKAAAE